MAASPNPLNSTFAGCRGRAVTGSARFSLWFFSCTRDYLFLAVPSPRLMSRAAAALPFAFAEGRRHGGHWPAPRQRGPRGSRALGTGWLLSGRAASAAAAQRPGLEAAPAGPGSEQPAEGKAVPGPAGPGAPRLSSPSFIPLRPPLIQKGIVTRCEHGGSRGSELSTGVISPRPLSL